MKTVPVVMSVAGSDNSAGAGIQADLKTFAALGTYGVTALTCVVAEVPGQVTAIQPLEPALVVEQARLLVEAFPVQAIKTGMLCSGIIADGVADFFDRIRSEKIPLVVDPVMVATSGDALLTGDAMGVYQNRLFPVATVVTPNLDEVAALLGRAIRSLGEMREAGRELVGRYGVPFLVKGGHLRGEEAVDLLVDAEGEWEFRGPYVQGVSTHGTGCTYSAAITAGLGRGLGLREAVSAAKEYVGRAIGGYLRWEKNGRVTDALQHMG
jgi:hydroxymethylpyrimidine/phosphomethylpyrimidine kinase